MKWRLITCFIGEGFLILFASNLVPRVLWLFGQRVGASRDSGYEIGSNPDCSGRFLLLLPRIRSAYLEILGFPMGGAY